MNEFTLIFINQSKHDVYHSTELHATKEFKQKIKNKNTSSITKTKTSQSFKLNLHVLVLILTKLLALKLSTTNKHFPNTLTSLNFNLPSSTLTGTSTLRFNGILPVCCCSCNADIKLLAYSVCPVKSTLSFVVFMCPW